MSVNLLNEESVIPYLKSRGVIAQDEEATVEILAGGVSNVVLAIQTATQDMVLKQALAELKVATKWVVDQRRAIVEAHAIEVFHAISPKQVPALIGYDPELFTLVLERVPRTSTVWKSDLLEGNIRPEIGEKLGHTLAMWHNYAAKSPALQEKFSEDSLFEQLRIDPFYRTVASKNPDLSTCILKLIDELKSNKTTLVHGDFSPKNIMVDHNRDIYILDFEVTHTGNPVFDLAFLTAHLLCKYFRAQNQRECELLKFTAQSFLSAYKEAADVQPPTSLAWHSALIALARVEGTSLVNYLDESAQLALAQRCKRALASQSPLELMYLFTKESI